MEKLQISRKELERAYHEMLVPDAAKKYGVSVVTFYGMLDEAKIPRKMPRKTYEIIE